MPVKKASELFVRQTSRSRIKERKRENATTVENIVTCWCTVVAREEELLKLHD